MKILKMIYNNLARNERKIRKKKLKKFRPQETQSIKKSNLTYLL